MIDWNEIRENLAEWLKNPHWAEYYYSAPSERCRGLIAMEFYHSVYYDAEVIKAEKAIEETMDTDELRHLYRWCGNNPRKGTLARKIAEKEKKER